MATTAPAPPTLQRSTCSSSCWRTAATRASPSRRWCAARTMLPARRCPEASWIPVCLGLGGQLEFVREYSLCQCSAHLLCRAGAMWHSTPLPGPHDLSSSKDRLSLSRLLVGGPQVNSFLRSDSEFCDAVSAGRCEESGSTALVALVAGAPLY